MRFLPESVVSWTPPALAVGAGFLLAYALSMFAPVNHWEIDESLQYWWVGEALALLVTPYFHIFRASQKNHAGTNGKRTFPTHVLVIFIVVLYTVLAAGLAWELEIGYFIIPEFLLFLAMKYFAFRKLLPAASVNRFDEAFAPWLRTGAAVTLGVLLLLPLQLLWAVFALALETAGANFEWREGVGSLGLAGGYFLALGVLEKGWLSEKIRNAGKAANHTGRD